MTASVAVPTPSSAAPSSVESPAPGSTENLRNLRFTIHSTYRHKSSGRRLAPEGLQWGMGGISHLVFLPWQDSAPEKGSSSNTTNITKAINTDGLLTRWGMIQAYNAWAFAKQIPFKRLEDIDKIEPTNDGVHLRVTWKDGPKTPEALITDRDIRTMLEKEKVALPNSTESLQVWLNGQYVADLQGPESLPPILDALSKCQSHRLSYRKADGLIRIERKFKGYLFNRSIVFEHVLDNLLAMEDVKSLDERTLIGTATLPDWIMGGQLTSRIWVQELENGNVAFERPLYQDDISTSDRTFELKKEDGEYAQLIRVKQELKRLRAIGKHVHPFEEQLAKMDNTPKVEEVDPAVERRRKNQQTNQRMRRFKGL